MLKFVKGFVLMVAFFGFGSFIPHQDSSKSMANLSMSSNSRLKTVVLDAGHGGKDPGCCDGNEKKISLKIVLALGKKISEAFPDVKVVYTRKKDTYPTLHERSTIANDNKADLFICVHCNSNPNSSAISGTEIYVMGMHKTNENLEVAKRENAVVLQEKDYKKTYKGYDLNSPLAHIMMANYQNAFMANSIKLAKMVGRYVKKNTDLSFRGVKQAGFMVLWETAMPSIYVESGYLTNTHDHDNLISEKGQEDMADAIFKAFADYKEEIEN
jgi:N-acetylmuramoyl-L-alanine amidase